MAGGLWLSRKQRKDILCHREQPYVENQLTLSYDRKRIVLERNLLSEGLESKYVDVYDFPDAAWKCAPSASCFPTVSSARNTNSQKLEYQKRGRRSEGQSHTAIIENYVPKIPVRSVQEGATPSQVEQTG